MACTGISNPLNTPQQTVPCPIFSFNMPAFMNRTGSVEKSFYLSLYDCFSASLMVLL